MRIELSTSAIKIVYSKCPTSFGNISKFKVKLNMYVN